jgi:hypothetical protein
VKHGAGYGVKNSEFVIGLLLIALALLLYQLSGGLANGSTDNVPHTLLGFNWLEHHTLNLDSFRDSYLLKRGDGDPHYFLEAPNGHLTSTYPVGTALVTFPLYLLFFGYLKLVALLSGADPALNLTSSEFDATRLLFAKLAASICSALSVGLLYWGLRLKFSRGTALLVALTYGFATTTWVLNSQDLRQHTVSNLLLTALLLCLLKANRTTGRVQVRLLVLAGLFCGLLPSVRLTSAIFAAAALVYSCFAFRRRGLWLLLGLLSILPHWIWNSYYFGLENFARGGYSRQFAAGASSYVLSVPYFVSAFLGQLVSPSDGLFVYSPVLLLALGGFYIVWRQRAGRDEQLILLLALASVGLFLQYCFYNPWDGGGGSYGPRFLTDVLPVACFLIAYVLEPIPALLSRSVLALILPLFLLTLLWSVAVQAIGVFSDTSWGKVPLPLTNQPERRWSLTDTQIERHFRNLLVRISPPIRDPQAYASGLAGQLVQLEQVRRTGKIEPIQTDLVLRSGVRRRLQAQIKNTGQSGWFGYQTGLEDKGETRLRLDLFDADGRRMRVPQGYLYISGSPQPGDVATATGLLGLPARPGTYRAELMLTMAGHESKVNWPPLYRFKLTVNQKPETSKPETSKPETSKPEA